MVIIADVVQKYMGVLLVTLVINVASFFVPPVDSSQNVCCFTALSGFYVNFMRYYKLSVSWTCAIRDPKPVVAYSVALNIFSLNHLLLWTSFMAEVVSIAVIPGCF